ncbi:MAG: hypothetical protein ACEQSR_01145 [Candidatus Methylacidiphilales bacterium]
MTKYNLIIILIFLASCHFHENDQDSAVCVNNIISKEDSKQLGVFIKNCYPKKVKINDSINLDIIDAWCEYNFLFSDLENDYKLKDDYKPINYHLVLRIKGDFSKNNIGYNNHWSFENISFIGFDTVDNISVFITSSINTKPIKDSFPINIYGIIQSIDPNKYNKLYDLDTFYILTNPS